MASPKISIIMPAYNSEKYLSEAIESILGQTFKDFEFLIADDGSTDNTPEILDRYAKLDDRIRIITNPTNLGLPKTLNKLIKESSSDIVARMDSDDKSVLNRLEKQYHFMNKNKDISLCSSFLVSYETKKITKTACSNDSIKAVIPFKCPMVHPAIIYRKSHIVSSAGGYDENFPCAEDYNLWARLSFDPKIKFANIPEPLIIYREHPEKIDTRVEYLNKIMDLSNITRIMIIKKLVPSITKKEVINHINISTCNTNVTIEELDSTVLWLKKLESAVVTSGYCNPRSFKFFINNIYKDYSMRINIEHTLKNNLQKKAL